MAFEINGTKGAISWDFERMNELQLYLPGEDGRHDGFMRLVGGDRFPYHGNFNPGDGSGIGYEDMKVIECLSISQGGGFGAASRAWIGGRAGGGRCTRGNDTLLGERQLGSCIQPANRFEAGGILIWHNHPST